LGFPSGVFERRIEIRFWDKKDAHTARPTRLPFKQLLRIAERITDTIPEVVSVTYPITPKPPLTMEAV
jgi:GMP synthase (glutamine-hydrolysing)